MNMAPGTILQSEEHQERTKARTITKKAIFDYFVNFDWLNRLQYYLPQKSGKTILSLEYQIDWYCKCFQSDIYQQILAKFSHLSLWYTNLV